MKKVYVLRHSMWDNVEDTLTPDGIEKAKSKKEALPEFRIVAASPLKRAQQTAELLSGKTPEVSENASVPNTPPEVRDYVMGQKVTHPLGIAGAFFDTKEAQPALKTAGQRLVTMIQAILGRLEDGENGLIVSHDGTILAAERLLEGGDFEKPLEHSYAPGEGFVVDETLQTTPAQNAIMES